MPTMSLVPRFLLPALASFLASAVLASCAGSTDSESVPPEGTSSIVMSLVNVPSDALCLEISIAPTADPLSAQRQLFTLTPGTSPTLTMGGLPAGPATITELAFGIACAQVQSGTTPTWVSAAPVTLNLVAGQTVTAAVVLQRPGSVQITSTFDDGSLSVTPAQLSFGDVALGLGAGKTITVTNSSSAQVQVPTGTVSGANASEFFRYGPLNGECATYLDAGQSCIIGIEFAPTTTGAKTATYTLGSSSVSLTGNGVNPGVSVTPSQLSFGDVALGVGAGKTLTVTNSSAVTELLPTGTVSGANASEFFRYGPLNGECATYLDAGQSCIIGIEFAPTTTGAKTATYTLGSSSVSLTGNGVNPGVSVTPSQLSFGDVALGVGAGKTLTVTNSSAVTELLPTGTVSGANTSEFFRYGPLNGECATYLDAGQSCIIGIEFAPTTTGAKTATYTLGSSSVSLTGNGVNPGVSVTPSQLSFGDVALGVGAGKTLTVTNSSAVTELLPTGTVSGANASEFFRYGPLNGECATYLDAGQSCIIGIEFAPTTTGAKTATYTLGSSSVSLTGNGVNPGVSVTPGQLSFGSVAVGASAASSMTVTNPSSVTVLLPTGTISGTNASEFVLSGSLPNQCGTYLDAGQSCALGIKFLPTSAGAKTATFTLGSATVSLTGTGASATPTPVYQIDTGGSSAVSPYIADQYFSGGTSRSVTNTITISGITNPAPQAVYQSERYGNSTYTLPNLTAGGQYTVRLHFAELYWTATGKRVFNVAINGATVLSNFDVYAVAGASYKAVLREFTATASSSGQIVIKFTTVTDNATIEGIEIIK